MIKKMPKYPKEHKFTFTFKDIAEAKGTSRSAALNSAYIGYYNPNDLRSITRYVYGGMIRDLKQTLEFWKKKAQKGG